MNRSEWIWRYGASTALLNLCWELLQLPLYSLWVDGSAGEIAYAVLHCTVGDLLIASICLGSAVLLVRPGKWPKAPSVATTLLTVAFGVGYTIHSEWYNTTVAHAWAYSDWMPQVSGIGLSPLAQ